ncbi:MAG TPA: hypothetical protein DEB40_05220 [Elusimicrobia bacterium]|nr:hypothetical protein [Elusimicrobiota bacterium]HBT61125.1 hypothetical protein [Elusimicrobiota bacterium]
MSDTEPSLLYRFTLQDGSTREFPVNFDSTTLKVRPRERSDYPAWTCLSFCRCPNCPLDESRHPLCPTAQSVMDIVDVFQNSVSTEPVIVDIISQRRTFQKRTTLTDGVSALMGVLMPTSGCPVLGLLRPNVLTHLPFASPEETAFRTLAMYLLAQYFVSRNGKAGDWDLKGIDAMIENVHLVNRHFAQRLKNICPKDVNLNAIVRLDTLASLTVHTAKKMTQQLDVLEPMFDCYLPRKD